MFNQPQLAQCLQHIAQSQPITLAYLFGSAALGQTTPLSDIDIALVVTDAVSPNQRLHFELAIEDEIAGQCGLSEVDVRVINEAPLMVKGQVVTYGVLLYARDQASRVDFETNTRMAYFDFLPVAQMMQQAFFQRLKEKGIGNGCLS